MKIGTGMPNQVPSMPSDTIPAWAHLAEESGFASLTTVGRQAYPGLPDTIALAGAAAVTHRIELISGVLLAATWPAPLLARELAGIDGMSGGRPTFGLAAGQRPDDFIAEGYGSRGRGARLDRDLETYREIWRGAPVGGGPNPAVPRGTRQIPMLFGGHAPAAMNRMARWGEGYIGGAVPTPMVAPSFDAARDAWRRAGRQGPPRLLALAYFALGDSDKGRRNVYEYYSLAGGEFAGIVAGAVCDSPATVRERISSLADIGVDEISFITGTDDLDEVKRLADIVF